MIPNFTTIVQCDLIQIYDYVSGKVNRNEEQNKKIILAAFRTLTVIGMAFAALKIITTLTFVASTLVGAAFSLAFLIGVYLLFRDSFLLAKNEDEKLNVQNPITHNTFYKPLWNVILIKV